MDCTQVLVESDEEDNVPEEDDRRQVASLSVNEDSFPIFLGENKIGRDAASCSVVIANMALSSQHAVIQGLECGMFLIYDLSSTNKTKIGKMTLAPNVRYQLKSGDVVRLANVSCIFHFERDIGSNSSASTNQMDDYPSTQVIVSADDEEAVIEVRGSNAQHTIGEKCSAVKHPDRPREHLFKMPAVTPPRNKNDSFEHKNESKDSSCLVDSDDEIFELLTQPSHEEPATYSATKNDSANNKNPGDGDQLLSKGESDISDEDDIFSAATEDFTVSERKNGSSSVVSKNTDNKDSRAFNEDELNDEENIFSASTEGLPSKCNKKKESNISPIDTVVKHSDALGEGEITDENILYAATEDFHLKPKEKRTPEVEGKNVKDKDAWEEFGIADEDDIFSVATEDLPVTSNEDIHEKSGKDTLAGENDASEEDEVTDEEDIFSAATEAIPVQSIKKSASKTNSKHSVTKNAKAIEEDEVTDEEDIFSAATEAIPVQSIKKSASKTNSKHSVTKNAKAIEEDEVTDEEDIFSAATEAIPVQSIKKSSSKTNSKHSVTKNAKAIEEDEVTDEEDIFSAATEAIPVQSIKKSSSKTNSKHSVTKNAKAIEEDEVTLGREGKGHILCSTRKDLPHGVLKNSRNVEKGAACSEVRGTRSIQLVEIDQTKSTGRKNVESIKEDIFSAATQGLPLSCDNKNHDEGSMSNSVNVKIVLEEEENCDNEGFVKDLLSVSNSEHLGRGVDKSLAVCNTMATVSEPGNSKRIAHENSPLEGKGVEKLEERGIVTVREINVSGMEIESESDETDVEDEVLDMNTTEEKSQGHSALKAVVKESTSESGKSKCSKSDIHQSCAESAPEYVPDEDGDSHLKDPMASFVVISDTEDEDEEKSCINSTMENPEENKTVKSLAIGCNYSGSNKSADIAQNASLATKELLETTSNKHGVNETNTIMMAIDETLPTTCIIVTKTGIMTSVNNPREEVKDDEKAGVDQIQPKLLLDNEDGKIELCSFSKSPCKREVVHSSGPVGTSAPRRESLKSLQGGNEVYSKKSEDIGRQKIIESNAQGDMNSKASHTNIMDDACEKSQVSTPGSIQIKSVLIGDEDEEEFVAETPVFERNIKRGKGLLVFHMEDVGEEEEVDMSSFLTEAPPEFKTPVIGLKSSGEEDLSDFEIQLTPNPTVSHILEKKGIEEEDEEDMSSFLTQAPPEFKTPEASIKKLDTDEEDWSELQTQPAPVSSGTHTPCKEKDEYNEEEMSSFLTEVPPEFKTPVAGVQKIIEEEDLSDLATQPAPVSEEKCKEKKGTNTIPFLPQKQAEFKILKIGIKEIIVEEEEEEDLSDLATQPAPRCNEEVGNEGEDMSSFITEAPPEFKTPNIEIRNIYAEEEEDLSDFATQPAPVNEEECKEKGEMDSFLAKEMLESKPPCGQEMHARDEEDLSEFETQPAPVVGIDHCPCLDETVGGVDSTPSSQSKRVPLQTQLTETKFKKEQESEEENRSFLDSEPVPCVQLSNKLADEQKKGKAPAVDQIREKLRREKVTSETSSKENVASLRGKSCYNKNIEFPNKVCHSPKTGRKISKDFSVGETQVEEDNSSDSEFEFSSGLPDTPELVSTLKESENKFPHSHTSCRNLFAAEKSGQCTSVSSSETLKGLSKEELIILPASKKSTETVHKEQIKPDVVKVSKIAKAAFNEKNTACPPKKHEELKNSKERPVHMDFKDKGSVTHSKKGFSREPGITMVGLNNMKNLQNINIEKCKSRTESLLREVVVTSTPIHMCEVSSEHDGTPWSSTDTSEKKTTKQPIHRGRRKAGGAKSDVEHVDKAKDVVSQLVCGGDAGKMLSSIKVEDVPSNGVPDVQKCHNLRLRKPLESHATVKAGTKRSKEPQLNLPSGTGTLQVKDPSISSLNERSLHATRKRNIPSSLVEMAPVAKAPARIKKHRKKKEFDEVSPVNSKNQIQPAECPEKRLTLNKFHKECVRDTSESGNVEMKFSPGVFYGKQHKSLKSKSSAISRTESSVDTIMRKETQDKDSQSWREDRNISAAFPEPIRRSEREKKPKKRFIVDSSPVKPKRNKNELKSPESIPSLGRTTGVARMDFSDFYTLSDSVVNSSQEKAIPSDSSISVSKKRVSDDDQTLRNNKRSRTSDDSSSVKVVARGGIKGRYKEGSSPLRHSLHPPPTKSNDKSKLVDGNSHGLQKGVTKAREEKQESQVVHTNDGGAIGRVHGTRRGKKEPMAPEACTNASVTKSKVEEAATSEPKETPDQLAKQKRVSKRLKERSYSERTEVCTTKEENSWVNQDESLRESYVESIMTGRRGRNELASANFSKMNFSSLEVCDESKDAKSNGDMGGESASIGRGRRRKINPVITVGNTKEDKSDKRKEEQPPTLRVVPPLRISRGRIVSESVKSSDAVALGSPVYSESILEEHVQEEKPKRARKQKKDAVCVLFTGINDTKLNQIVERLGGSIVETPQNCTVLVTDRLRRTYKLLCAIARGIPIVTTQWLIQSSSSSRFLDPMDFLVVDKLTEKRFDFTLKSSLEKARVQPILSGYSFIATPSVKPPPEEVEGIVTCAGGQYISSLKEVKSRLTHLFYVVSCADDSAIWDEYTETGAKRVPRSRGAQRGKASAAKGEASQANLVGVEGLLVSVLRQKADFKNKEFNLC